MLELIKGIKRLVNYALWVLKERNNPPKYRLKDHLTLKVAKTNNFWRVESRQIKYIVLHATRSSTLKSAVNWFQNPASGASSHFLVDKNGEVTCMVPVQWIAWHAGKNINFRGRTDGFNRDSLGIELVNKDDGKELYTLEQVEACLTLCNALATTYGIPRENIVRHKDIAPSYKHDPQYFDYDGLQESLAFYKEKKEALR